MMKTKTHGRLITILVVVLCLAALTAGWLCFDTFVDRSGWREKDGQHYYRDFHGKKVTGWLQNEYGKYYLGDDSYMVTGWQTVNGKTFHFGDDGVETVGWLDDGEYRYYLTLNDGTVSGEQMLEGKPYYFTPDGIYVLLVNDENPIPKSYEPELVDLDGKFQVASVCVEALRKMLADCLAAGDVYSINNTYRSYEEQQKVLSDRIQRYMDEDPKLSEAEATEKARREVTRPGTSEHELGLAVDIVDASYQHLDEQQESTPVQQWLMEHCWEYGFILRYPNGKSDLTGIIYEPWHYRYVGVETAQALRESGQCLEEYLQAAKAS